MARLLAPTASAGRPLVRRRFARWLAASLAAMCATSMARAQSAGNLPFDVTASTLATTDPIDKYVQQLSTDLATGDPEKLTSARVALLAPLAGNPGSKSQAFLSAYAHALNASLLPVATGDSPPAKLNAAIVAIRAAEQSHSPELIPLVAKLASDPSPAVASFGLRAAGNLIVYSLADPVQRKNNALVAAIAQALTGNGESDAVVMEAFQALTRDALDPKTPNDLVAQATPALVDAIHQMMDIRVDQFANGNNIVEPAAELTSITFLTRTGTWSASTPAQQAQTVGFLTDLMQTAVDELVAAPVGQNRARSNALRTLAQASASGLNVVAKQAGNAGRNLLSVTNEMTRLGGAAAPAQFQDSAAKITAEALKLFPDAAAPTTAPTTAPASQPAAAS